MGILEKSKVLRTPSWSTFFTSARLSRGTPGAPFRCLGAAPGVTWGLLPESPWQATGPALGSVLAAALAGGTGWPGRLASWGRIQLALESGLPDLWITGWAELSTSCLRPVQLVVSGLALDLNLGPDRSIRLYLT